MDLEHVLDDEVFFNFALLEYEPKKSFAGKLRVGNILLYSFDILRCNGSYYNLVKEIRKEIGLNQTVWGIKKIGNVICWELYFYRQYQPDKIKIKEIGNIFAKHFAVGEFDVDEDLPYLMFSFDLESNNDKIENLHMYFDEPVENNFRAWSYKIRENQKEYENYYEFVLSSDKQRILAKLFASPYIDSQVDVSRILIPELMDCTFLCFAAKRNENGIYFWGINVEQFIFFLKQFDYPEQLVAFVEKHKENLDYVQFDVGFDYYIEGNTFKIRKSGFYGTF
ncbi:MAG: hypothetical protein SVW57_14075 [Thermodesulfobacteriota bacterium]|nr:hypothetical protein [Thermodesulfobacteriota bacterium]